MRQLIARIEDELHQRLKERAAAERRSLNSLVRELLLDGLPDDDGRDRLRARVEAAGLRVIVPEPDQEPPSRDEIIAATRGLGTAASEALAADRAHRP